MYFVLSSTSLILFFIRQPFCVWLALADGDTDCKQNVEEHFFNV